MDFQCGRMGGGQYAPTDFSHLTHPSPDNQTHSYIYLERERKRERQRERDANMSKMYPIAIRAGGRGDYIDCPLIAIG